MQKEKYINILTFLKIWIADTIVMNDDVTNEMTKNRINHDKKKVLSSSPIIFIPSLDFDSFSEAIFDVM